MGLIERSHRFSIMKNGTYIYDLGERTMWSASLYDALCWPTQAEAEVRLLYMEPEAAEGAKVVKITLTVEAV